MSRTLVRLSMCAVGATLLAAGGLATSSRAQLADDGTTLATPSRTVTVFAAASLTAAFQAMAVAFEKDQPAVKVQLNFSGSATLVQQIQEGAPADVFAAADEVTMQKLVEGGTAAAAPAIFARNTLQIAVARGNPKHITALADLARPGLIIALCGPTVPCGRYALEAFHKAGVALPAASQELDVKAVVSKVAMGEVDAGIVYATDVRAAGGTVEGVDIPAAANVVARYPIVALSTAPSPAVAAAFVAFVLSAHGQQVLGDFGFLPR